MPWDGTELVVAALGKDCALADPRTIAGGQDVSIFQPQWSPDGKLIYSSDHEGAWTLYQSTDGRQKRLIADGTSVGGPAWMFGYSVYTFLSGGRIACITMNQGQEQLAVLSPDGSLTPIPLDFKAFFYPALTSDGEDTLYFTAGGPTRSSVIAGYNTRTGDLSILRETMALPFDHAYLSEPQHITFPTTGGDVAHALYYPPSNPDFEAPPGELPPLLVQSHGGPTASAPKYLKLLYQYWTSRGFAIMDVDYRGSTGYGRAYWKKLYGQWGVIDVEDCVEAAKYAAANGLADPDRMAISGGSAGGYVTLCALAFHDVFRAGSSWYGIGDLETLVGDFHKFESHYCDMLAANTYPAPKELLYSRSPIHFLDRLNAPMILLQGKDDTVVPPDQAEDMAKALDARGLPYVLLMFDGEGHGFRKAETLRRCMEAETYFFSQVFDFTPADPVEPVEIHNLPAR
jgi:dipeptidyl aminopeptidase/acylaminoacyl peptidase